MAEKLTGNPILGILVIITAVVGGAAMEGFLGESNELLWLLVPHPVAFFIVMGGALCAVLMGCGLKVPLSELVSLLKGQQRDYAVLRRALRLVIYAAPLSGSMGSLMGLIHILAYMSDQTRVETGLMFSTMPMIYGWAVALVGIGLRSIALRRSEPSERDAGSDDLAPGDTLGRPLIGGCLVALSFPILHMSEGGHLGDLMNPTAMGIVAGVLLGLLLMSTRVLKPLRQLANVLLHEDVEDSSLVEALHMLSLSAPLVGIATSVLGSAAVWLYIDNPARLGVGVAVAYLGLLYAAGIGILAQGATVMAISRGAPRPSGSSELSLVYGPLAATAMFLSAMSLFMTILWAVPVK